MSFAARIAPEIDRLVLAVNTASEPVANATLAGMLGDVGLDSPDLLKHYADFLLAGRLTEDLAVSRLPYVPAETVRARIATWTRLDLAVPVDGHLGAADALVPLLEAILEARHMVASELWDGRGARAEALEHTSRVLAGIDHDRPLAAAHASLPQPGDPGLRLHQHLTTLRYVRSQAHATAWRSRGLDMDEIRVLTALWYGDPLTDLDAALGSLADRDMVDSGGAALTESGRRLREDIEADTNRDTGPVFEVLTQGDQDALLAALEDLPGDRP